MARVSVVAVDGEFACDRFVHPDHLSAVGFASIDVPCTLSRDGPATLLVETLGRADLMFSSVQLTWGLAHKPGAQYVIR